MILSNRLCLILCLSAFLIVRSTAFASSLRAGFATVDITPPLGLEMAGFGPYYDRRATGIHDPLMAHAVVMETDGRRIAIVACDLAAVSQALTQKVREEVARTTGIPGQRVMVNASHTHSGPAVPRWIGWGAQDEKYLNELPGKIAQAVEDASHNLHVVDLYYGEAPVEGVAANREYENGPTDKSVRVLKFMQGTKLLGFIVNYSVHNVLMSEENRQYSKDLTGVAIEKVLRDYPGAVGVYLQGSCGDINPVGRINHVPLAECLASLERLSDLFAQDIREAVKNASPMKVERVDMDKTGISLPLVPTDRALVSRKMELDDELLKEPNLSLRARNLLRFDRDSSRALFDRFRRLPLNERDTEIQVALIQNVLIASDPGEVFNTFADQISQMLPDWKVWVAGYTNDYIGYIPTPDKYDLEKEFSYPAYFTPMINGDFRYREDVGDVLVQHLVRFARHVCSRPSDGN